MRGGEPPAFMPPLLGLRTAPVLYGSTVRYGPGIDLYRIDDGGAFDGMGTARRRTRQTRYELDAMAGCKR